MASRAIPARSSGGGSPLDAPVAALAGLAVALLVFILPAETLETAIAATGLGNFVPAAQPPLGSQARALIGSVGALGIFALVFILMRGRLHWRTYELNVPAPPQLLRARDLEYPSSREATAVEQVRPAPQVEAMPAAHAGPAISARGAVEQPEPAPRLRRRDFHPDAHARPPLLAISELGAPPPPAAARSTPAFAGEGGHQNGGGEAFPPEPRGGSKDVGNDSDPALRPSTSPSSEPTPWQEEGHQAGSWLPTGSGEPAIAFREESLAQLIERLEKGLAKRRIPSGPEIADPLEPAMSRKKGPPSIGDDRLQNAIESLQRLAARPY